MKPLRRTTTTCSLPMQPLECMSMCDICNKGRGHGNHQKCSRIRKAHYDKVKGRV